MSGVLQNADLHHSLILICTTVLVLLIASLTSSYWRLHNVPGPFLAKFTDLWRLIVVWKRDSQDTYVAQHKKHGDIVRIGPNNVSISTPGAIPLIHGIQKEFVKSGFYEVWQNVVNGKRVASMVFTTDEAQHAAMKRPVAQAYSLSALVEFESLVDSTTAVLLGRLDEYTEERKRVCDLGCWLGWYAFDVIGELTFSKRLGFLERGEDVEDISATVAKNFDRCSVLGQMPWLDGWTWKSWWYQKFFASPAGSPIIGFGQRRLQERLDGKDDGNNTDQRFEIRDPALKEKVLHGTLPSRPDFLSRFLTLHQEQPDVVTDRQLLAYLFMNINAGSDTIASTVRALFYYLLKHPSTMISLYQELEEGVKAGTISTPLPTWTECQHLPYLNAVIKESLRLNPALGLPLERIVPPSGLRIKETYIPPGTVVGINPWVLHRDTRIFGRDAESWRPERWLDRDGERVKYMDQHLLAFGAGKRTCMGKNIAMLELVKVVPALVLRYEMKLERPDAQWKVWNAWAVRQEGLEVVLERR